MFNRQVNRKYRQLLKTLLTSDCGSEILTGIRQLNNWQINRCLSNFSQKRTNSSFDVNSILFKNPTYRKVMKELILNDTERNSEHWEQRLTYWEPLFFKFNETLSSDSAFDYY